VALELGADLLQRADRHAQRHLDGSRGAHGAQTERLLPRVLLLCGVGRPNLVRHRARGRDFARDELAGVDLRQVVGVLGVLGAQRAPVLGHLLLVARVHQLPEEAVVVAQRAALPEHVAEDVEDANQVASRAVHLLEARKQVVQAREAVRDQPARRRHEAGRVEPQHVEDRAPHSQVLVLDEEAFGHGDDTPGDAQSHDDVAQVLAERVRHVNGRDRGGEGREALGHVVDDDAAHKLLGPDPAELRVLDDHVALVG
jgi:hypothetical protein